MRDMNAFENGGDPNSHGLGRQMMHGNFDIPPGQDESENEYGRTRFGNVNDRGPDSSQDGLGNIRSSENEGFNWNASETPGDYGSSGFGRGMDHGRLVPPPFTSTFFASSKTIPRLGAFNFIT